MAERGIEVQDAGWEKMFRDRGLDPLRLYYEDVVARPGEAQRRVADYLGVELVPGAEVPVPAVLKQSAEGSEDWGSRYERARTGEPHPASTRTR